MSDFVKQITEQKHQDAVKIFRSSGPPTVEENVLREKAATVVVEALSASAMKLMEYGVPEDVAYGMIFNSITDEALLRMTKRLWNALYLQKKEK